MSNGWTDDRRRLQSEKIHRWKPWLKAGVRTEQGKEISKMNAYKHGGRCAEIRKAEKELAEWKRALSQMI